MVVLLTASSVETVGMIVPLPGVTAALVTPNGNEVGVTSAGSGGGTRSTTVGAAALTGVRVGWSGGVSKAVGVAISVGVGMSGPCWRLQAVSDKIVIRYRKARIDLFNLYTP